MTTIYLVRHGQKIPEAGDPGLTEIGWQQARETGEFLKQFPITQIIASPFQRTVETAAQITQVLGSEFSLSPALVERMNWNDPSVSRKQFFQEWIKSTNNREYVPKYGDSSLTTGHRIETLVSEMTRDESHVLLVTHGGAILDYLRNMVGDEPLHSIRTTYVEGNDFQMLNCAINKIVLSDKPLLELLNFTDHLSEKTE